MESSLTFWYVLLVADVINQISFIDGALTSVHYSRGAYVAKVKYEIMRHQVQLVNKESELTCLNDISRIFPSIDTAITTDFLLQI